MSAIAYPVAVAGGAVIGLLLSVFGGGGSVLATPLLLYGVGVRDPHVAPQPWRSTRRRACSSRRVPAG
jgi:hypothetical protein